MRRDLDVDDRDLLISAARRAAPSAMRCFRPGGAAESSSWRKADGGGLVTEADLEVNRILRETLLAERPGYGWLSEEDERAPAAGAAERVFVVDPIDGTRSFAEGAPEFCISIAVVEKGAPVAAAIFAPALEEMYDAVEGVSARLNGAAIQASDREGLSGARVLGVRRHFRDEHWPGGAPDVSLGYVQPIAYRMCLVARGDWDALVSLRPTNEWDVAAGDLIARCAGACVTDPSGEAYRFNKPEPRVPGAIAAPRALHDAVMERLTR